jgi:hypothetical protein
MNFRETRRQHYEYKCKKAADSPGAIHKAAPAPASRYHCQPVSDFIYFSFSLGILRANEMD